MNTGYRTPSTETYVANGAGLVGDIFAISVEGAPPIPLDNKNVDPKVAREIRAGSDVLVVRDKGDRMDDLAQLLGYPLPLDLPIRAVSVRNGDAKYSILYRRPKP